MHFGFSYTGIIFLIMLFVPNIIWSKNQPEGYAEYSAKENKVLLLFERIGEVLVSVLVLIFKELNVRLHSVWLFWLIAALILMILYECYWIKYFKSEKTMADMYSSYAGFPVAGASLPVIAVLFLGIYASNIFIIISSLILGIGHIGIHLAHRREALGMGKNKESGKKGGTGKNGGSKAWRIIRRILMAPVILVIGVIVFFIAMRNINFFKCYIDTDKGIDESIYVDINGQEQFITIRGRDKEAPVILYLHGGPGSPDSPMTYTFTNELIDEYTIVCWDQRGCGRTYVKNRDKDNKTATFEQAVSDTEVLVDYLRERFGQDKIIIMGHSYGSVLGSRFAYDHPEKTTAFIGVGQFVSFPSSVDYEYADALEKAEAAGDDTTALTQAYVDYRAAGTIEASGKLSDLAAPYHKASRQKSTILAALMSPTLSTEDFLWFTKQLSYESFMQYSGRLMNYLMNVNLRETQGSYDVPVFFISGGCDWNCAWPDMKSYAEQVGAKYDVIPDCGHYVHNDAPKEFADIVKADLEGIITD